MENLIYLNDLLNITEEELNHTKIKFNQYNGVFDPMNLYTKNPDTINKEWLFWRTEKRNFNIGQIAICLLKLSYDTWLLTTVKKITKEFNLKNAVNYEGEEISRLKPYLGRIIIKYQKSHQSQCVLSKNYINKLEVIQMLPSVFDGENFPGYDKVRLSFLQLETIINRNKLDWIAALENQKAVYLISDTSNGKHYVGSATCANGMLLQRWRSYVSNGHGGNKELVEIVNQKEFKYIKDNFQYSILENYNAKVDDHVILERESWWKETLSTRRFGYNSN